MQALIPSPADAWPCPGQTGTHGTTFQFFSQGYIQDSCILPVDYHHIPIVLRVLTVLSMTYLCPPGSFPSSCSFARPSPGRGARNWMTRLHIPFWKYILKIFSLYKIYSNYRCIVRGDDQRRADNPALTGRRKIHGVGSRPSSHPGPYRKPHSIHLAYRYRLKGQGARLTR